MTGNGRDVPHEDIMWREPGDAEHVFIQCPYCGRSNKIMQFERRTAKLTSEQSSRPKDDDFLSMLVEIFECAPHELTRVDCSTDGVIGYMVFDRECEACGEPLDMWDLRAQITGFRDTEEWVMALGPDARGS